MAATRISIAEPAACISGLRIWPWVVRTNEAFYRRASGKMKQAMDLRESACHLPPGACRVDTRREEVNIHWDWSSMDWGLVRKWGWMAHWDGIRDKLSCLSGNRSTMKIERRSTATSILSVPTAGSGVLDANQFVTGPLGANWIPLLHQVQHCTTSRRSMELELFWYRNEQWITQRGDDQSQPTWQNHTTPKNHSSLRIDVGLNLRHPWNWVSRNLNLIQFAVTSRRNGYRIAFKNSI
jgi:hypothetical protein